MMRLFLAMFPASAGARCCLYATADASVAACTFANRPGDHIKTGVNRMCDIAAAHRRKPTTPAMMPRTLMRRHRPSQPYGTRSGEKKRRVKRGRMPGGLRRIGAASPAQPRQHRRESVRIGKNRAAMPAASRSRTFEREPQLIQSVRLGKQGELEIGFVGDQIAKARRKDDVDVRHFTDDFFGQRDAGHARQIDIREQDVECLTLHGFKRLFGSGCAGRFMTEHQKHLANEFARAFVVFDYKNVKLGWCH
jgi:hypothetical protein